MQFRYVGDKEDMAAFGYDFSAGNCPDVTDANTVKRLSGNSHFEAVAEEKRGPGRPKKVEEAPAE